MKCGCNALNFGAMKLGPRQSKRCTTYPRRHNSHGANHRDSYVGLDLVSGEWFTKPSRCALRAAVTLRFDDETVNTAASHDVIPVLVA